MMKEAHETPIESIDFSFFEKKKIKASDMKVELERMKRSVAKHAEICYLDHDIEFVFDHISYNTKTVFIRELNKSNNFVKHECLSSLFSRIREINKRFVLGVLTTRTHLKGDEANTNNIIDDDILEKLTDEQLDELAMKLKKGLN